MCSFGFDATENMKLRTGYVFTPFTVCSRSGKSHVGEANVIPFHWKLFGNSRLNRLIGFTKP